MKAVGAYAMIDDGELDWKIVCIRAEDPLADKINDIEDVERWGCWPHRSSTVDLPRCMQGRLHALCVGRSAKGWPAQLTCMQS